MNIFFLKCKTWSAEGFLCEWNSKLLNPVNLTVQSLPCNIASAPASSSFSCVKFQSTQKVLSNSYMDKCNNNFCVCFARKILFNEVNSPEALMSSICQVKFVRFFLCYVFMVLSMLLVYLLQCVILVFPFLFVAQKFQLNQSSLGL